ncbi:hypothetical protein ACHAWO_000103 [Cyclotella atomus]|uniref:BZIP domain-containing protein n=1 Tax=Cyclotella atomus TaxID=382360 RepID=A0ABD3QSB5_9STRA
MNNLIAAAAAAMEHDSNSIMDNQDATVKNNAGDAAAHAAAASNKRRRNNDNRVDVSAAKARRLEQNRRAAVESRRRKKVMMEELERSVSFYTKANASLATSNRHLEHQLLAVKQRMVEMGLSPPSSSKGGDSKVSAEVNQSKMEPSVELSDVITAGSNPKCPIQDEVAKLAASAVLPCPGVDLSQKPTADHYAAAQTSAASSASAGNDEDEYLQALKQVSFYCSALFIVVSCMQ